jgi:hypothetical protein
VTIVELRVLLEVLRGHAEPPHVRANVQHLLLVDIEVHVNRSGLDDGGELGPLAPTSSPSDTWLAVTMPSKGAFTSVAEVERGLRDIDSAYKIK